MAATQNAIFAAGWAAVALFGMTSTIGFLGKGVVLAGGWGVVALLGMTSTIGWIGKGIVLGVGLQLAIRVAFNLKPERLDWFYQPIKRQLSDREKKWGAAIFLAIFTVLSFF